MARRCLFGPVSKLFAEQNLYRMRQDGHCLAFDFSDEVDLNVGPADSWQTLCAKLPAGWQPDFLVLYPQ